MDVWQASKIQDVMAKIELLTFSLQIYSLLIIALSSTEKKNLGIIFNS